MSSFGRIWISAHLSLSFPKNFHMQDKMHFSVCQLSALIIIRHDDEAEHGRDFLEFLEKSRMPQPPTSPVYSPYLPSTWIDCNGEWNI